MVPWSLSSVVSQIQLQGASRYVYSMMNTWTEVSEGGMCVGKRSKQSHHAV